MSRTSFQACAWGAISNEDVDFHESFTCHQGCGTMDTCPMFIIDATSIACPRSKRHGDRSNEEEKQRARRKGSLYKDRVLLDNPQARALLLHWAGYRSKRRQAAPPPFTTAVTIIFLCCFS